MRRPIGARAAVINRSSAISLTYQKITTVRLANYAKKASWLIVSGAYRSHTFHLMLAWQAAVWRNQLQWPTRMRAFPRATRHLRLFNFRPPTGPLQLAWPFYQVSGLKHLRSGHLSHFLHVCTATLGMFAVCLLTSSCRRIVGHLHWKVMQEKKGAVMTASWQHFKYEAMPLDLAGTPTDNCPQRWPTAGRPWEPPLTFAVELNFLFFFTRLSWAYGSVCTSNRCHLCKADNLVAA